MNDNELKQFFTFLDKMRTDGKDMLTGRMALINEYGLTRTDAQDVIQQWWSAQGPGQENAARALKPVVDLPAPKNSQSEGLPPLENDKPPSLDEKLAKRFGKVE